MGDGRVRLLTALAAAALLGQLLSPGADAGGGGPTIGSVVFSGSGAKLAITVNGSGFGSAPVARLPYLGDTPDFAFTDTTRGAWQAGCDGTWAGGPGPCGEGSANAVTLDIASWTDGRIVIDGFGGAYGRNGWVVMPGDAVSIAVRNATGASARWTGRVLVLAIRSPLGPSLPARSGAVQGSACAAVRCGSPGGSSNLSPQRPPPCAYTGTCGAQKIGPAGVASFTTAPVAQIRASGPVPLVSDGSVWSGASGLAWYEGVAPGSRGAGSASGSVATMDVGSPQVDLTVPCTFTGTTDWSQRDGNDIAGSYLYCAAKVQVWKPLSAGGAEVGTGVGRWVDLPCHACHVRVDGTPGSTASVTEDVPGLEVDLGHVESYIRVGVYEALGDPEMVAGPAQPVSPPSVCSGSTCVPAPPYENPDTNPAPDLTQASAETTPDATGTTWVDAFAARYGLDPCPTGYSYPATFTNTVPPGPGQAPPPPAWGVPAQHTVNWNDQCVGPVGRHGHNWAFGPPIRMVVAPAALMQLKVEPYTIVYEPPGDKSKGTFSTTTAYGTNVSVGFSSTSATSTANQVSGGVDENVAAAYRGDGFDLGASQFWDTTTSVGTGVEQVAAATQGNSVATTVTVDIGNSSLVPGAAGAYGNEPFWSDTFVLLEDPQYAVWDLGGRVRTQLLGARGSPDAPSFAEPTVLDLFQCWAQNQYIDLDTDNCLSTAPTGAAASSWEYLSPKESHRLLQLDPFWASPLGQATPFAPGDGRAHFVGRTQYGMDPKNSGRELNPSFSQVISTTRVRNIGGSATYTASVTDVMGSTWSDGLKLDLVGFSAAKGGVTLQRGEQQTAGATATLTYSDSTAVTDSSATQIAGNLDDDTVRCGTPGDPTTCYAPRVKVYLDKMFGSYMFQDPLAPSMPFGSSWSGVELRAALQRILKARSMAPQIRHVCSPWPKCVLGGAGTTSSSAATFRDLGRYGWAQAAIGELAARGVIRGVARHRFDPEGVVTRAQFATLLRRLFRLPAPNPPVALRDVAKGAWDFAAAEAASPFLPVLAPGVFAPDRPVLRQDAAAALVRILAARQRLLVLDAARTRAVLARVRDAAQISPRLRARVASAIDRGIMSGFPDGSFRPRAPLTRAEAAVILAGFRRDIPKASRPPAVTGVSPATGPASGGTEIVVTGSGFTGATAVRFAGPAALGVGLGASLVVDSDGELTVTSPPGPGGLTVDLEVVTPAGTSAPVASDRFTYAASGGDVERAVTAPLVTGVEPAGGPAAGGTAVTITGSGFARATLVRFGSVPAASFTVVSDEKITAVSPPGAGTVDVTVTAARGTSPVGRSDRYTYR